MIYSIKYFVFNTCLVVVNVTSMSSQVGLARCSEALRAKFTDPNIIMEELTDLIKKFVEYSVTVMSVIQQSEMDRSRADDVIVNACCPGYVDTDLNSHQGTLTVDEGAVTPIVLICHQMCNHLEENLLGKRKLQTGKCNGK
ncbi:Carbonyl reductase [NADPH] 3 [Bulinus truncatus]|nr:Carbonyl reductase [NADPH] 3 [Bulinus truncatus]